MDAHVIPKACGVGNLFSDCLNVHPDKEKEKAMRNAPRVSVLMPAYNVEKYVGEAIESVLNQTFTDFEFIIINDGSTDNTAKIIADYAKKDKRIRFVNHRKNQGLIAVLNEGLDLCRGEYIARMDSDDISLPERFAKQIAYLDAHPECGVLGTWCEKFGENIHNQIWKYPQHVKLMDLLIRGSLVAHPSVMIRFDILKKHKIKYNHKYIYAEDYGLWSECIKHTEIHNLQERFLLYRWHSTNISNVHKLTQNKTTFEIKIKIINDISSNPVEINKILYMSQETNEYFYLFGLLPVVRRKQYATIKTKYYLFNKIPLIREQNGRIYLFDIIKIGIMKCKAQMFQ